MTAGCEMVKRAIVRRRRSAPLDAGQAGATEHKKPQKAKRYTHLVAKRFYFDSVLR
jgi:hypothetical protein